VLARIGSRHVHGVGLDSRGDIGAGFTQDRRGQVRASRLRGSLSSVAARSTPVSSGLRFAHPPYGAATALVPRKHIAGAGKDTASGAERPADDRTDGTAACSAPRGAGRFPGHRAGDWVSIPQMPHGLADAVTIGVARRTGISGHRCARRARCQSDGDRKNLEFCWHRHLRETSKRAADRP